MVLVVLVYVVARTERLREDVQLIAANVPAALTDEMYERLKSATFSILDKHGHPISCGFFVSSCGVALTSAHDAHLWMKKGKNKLTVYACDFNDRELVFDVVVKCISKTLDVAVLRNTGPIDAPLRPYLPLPPAVMTDREFLLAPVLLVHGSIARYKDTHGRSFGVDAGNIINVDATTMHYGIPTYKGHSGAALVLRGKQVIGLHSAGMNDLPQSASETSPSTSADAVRLDLPEIKNAVDAVVKKRQ